MSTAETEAETEPTHVEQLVQQQVAPTPVHLCNSSSTPIVTEQHGLAIYTSATDDTGALWERWSFWEAGRWEEVPRPTR